jgi:hypothetical protein
MVWVLFKVLPINGKIQEMLKNSAGFQHRKVDLDVKSPSQLTSRILTGKGSKIRDKRFGVPKKQKKRDIWYLLARVV